MFYYCYAINSTLLEVSHSDCQVEFIFEKISYPSGVLSCLSVCPLGTVTDLHRIGSDWSSGIEHRKSWPCAQTGVLSCGVCPCIGDWKNTRWQLLSSIWMIGHGLLMRYRAADGESDTRRRILEYPLVQVQWIVFAKQWALDGEPDRDSCH